MTGSTYQPTRWELLDTTYVVFAATGIQDLCNAGDTKDIDLTLTDDVLIRGIELLIQGGSFGDTVSITLIDVNAVTGAPPGTILLQPVVNWNVVTDSQKVLEYLAAVPKKALAGLVIRVSYTSTGQIPVQISINFNLLKVLI